MVVVVGGMDYRIELDELYRYTPGSREDLLTRLVPATGTTEPTYTRTTSSTSTGTYLGDVRRHHQYVQLESRRASQAVASIIS